MIDRFEKDMKFEHSTLDPFSHLTAMDGPAPVFSFIRIRRIDSAHGALVRGKNEFLEAMDRCGDRRRKKAWGTLAPSGFDQWIQPAPANRDTKSTASQPTDVDSSRRSQPRLADRIPRQDSLADAADPGRQLVLAQIAGCNMPGFSPAFLDDSVRANVFHGILLFQGRASYGAASGDGLRSFERKV